MENLIYLLSGIFSIMFILYLIQILVDKKLKLLLAEQDPIMQIHPFDSETCCQHAEGLFDDCFCGWCVHPEGTGPVDLSKVECDTCLERWS